MWATVVSSNLNDMALSPKDRLGHDNVLSRCRSHRSSYLVLGHRQVLVELGFNQVNAQALGDLPSATSQPSSTQMT